MTKGCCGKAMGSDADNFAVEFPTCFKHGTHRALLLCATLMLDYMYFEDGACRTFCWSTIQITFSIKIFNLIIVILNSL